MESFIILAYILTAFLWCGVDLFEQEKSLKNFFVFIGKFITFPYWVLKEKLK